MPEITSLPRTTVMAGEQCGAVASGLLLEASKNVKTSALLFAGGCCILGAGLVALVAYMALTKDTRLARSQ